MFGNVLRRTVVFERRYELSSLSIVLVFVHRPEWRVLRHATRLDRHRQVMVDEFIRYVFFDFACSHVGFGSSPLFICCWTYFLSSLSIDRIDLSTYSCCSCLVIITSHFDILVTDKRFCASNNLSSLLFRYVGDNTLHAYHAHARKVEQPGVNASLCVSITSMLLDGLGESRDTFVEHVRRPVARFGLIPSDDSLLRTKRVSGFFGHLLGCAKARLRSHFKVRCLHTTIFVTDNFSSRVVRLQSIHLRTGVGLTGNHVSDGQTFREGERHPVVEQAVELRLLRTEDVVEFRLLDAWLCRLRLGPCLIALVVPVADFFQLGDLGGELVNLLGRTACSTRSFFGLDDRLALLGVLELGKERCVVGFQETCQLLRVNLVGDTVGTQRSLQRLDLVETGRINLLEASLAHLFVA